MALEAIGSIFVYPGNRLKLLFYNSLGNIDLSCPEMSEVEFKEIFPDSVYKLCFYLQASCVVLGYEKGNVVHTFYSGKTREREAANMRKAIMEFLSNE